MKKYFSVSEVCVFTGVDRETITALIEKEWINPPATEFEAGLMDEEDIARIRFIRELREDLGANEEAVPIILHLVDQLCFLTDRIRKLSPKV